ncbi:DMT family transporter [Rhodovulum sulfidophilum]|uniref:DMT family transporter n=1 Tax=Rhodovulum sulfidophilum TaxID=35806 RepID=A0ABS1RNQ6_RHOSU|nr:DMT family transporter [Rhodovulum sulfidophilum]MBL3607528.1 DMT family transporter [Rhodovulum sulfidophilum]MCE8458443.1 DMT family transporter [Rhodovulum sulfidophilum]
MAASTVRGAGFALAGFAVYSGHDAVVKGLGAHYDAIQILFFSALLGFPLIALILIREGDGGSLWPRRPGWIALRTVAVMMNILMAFYAFSAIPLAETYAIIFSTPLIITALSVPILGERVGLRRWAAVVLGLIGVLIVLRPWGASELSFGHLAALISAGSSALVSVIVRKIGNEERSVVLLLYPLLANVVLMGCLLPVVYRPMPVAHLGGMALVAIGALTAMWLMINAYRASEAATVAPMQYSQMIWAVLIGSLFFDETPDATTLIGATVIAASGSILFLREGRAQVSGNQPALHATDRAGVAPGPVLPGVEESPE